MDKRTVVLTLDKAKEWYKKGGELREVALQAFTKNELEIDRWVQEYKSVVDNYDPDRRAISTKVVKSKFDEDRVLILLHNLAASFNNGWDPAHDFCYKDKYFIQTSRVTQALALKYPGLRYGSPYFTIARHKAVFYPGIAYFKSKTDAENALKILRDELSKVYIK